jgi:RimJ/RimL family protein N-acetyltransferase
MALSKREISDLTIETLARGFCHEAESYGFTQLEFVKFVNEVLNRSMHSEPPTPGSAERGPSRSVAGLEGPARRLPLRAARVAIRAFDAAVDLPLLDRWLMDTHGRDFLLSRVTAKRADIRELVREPSNTFGIITLQDSGPVGAMAFLDHDAVHRRAEMRKLIGEPAQRGKGLAKEASALWIRFGKEGLGLRKISVSTFHTSVRNVRLNQELGFRVEGILRNEVLLDGAYHDVLRMGLWTDGEPGDGDGAGSDVALET